MLKDKLRSLYGSKYYYLPKKYAHEKLFELQHGYQMNWESPVTLDEKIHRLTAGYGKAESKYADKILVREYVKNCGLEEMLPKLYGTWNDVKEINLSLLPERFVLKTNHASGGDYIIICKDKADVDWNAELCKIQKCLKINFAKSYCEYHYSYIKALVMAEELLDDGMEERMIDYKIHCFDGIPYCIQVISNRANGHIEHNTYDFNWNELDLISEDVHSSKIWKKPGSLEAMRQASIKLSKPFKYARIDFYDVKGKPYFGEITLSPAAGHLSYFNKKAQKALGDKIHI